MRTWKLATNSPCPDLRRDTAPLCINNRPVAVVPVAPSRRRRPSRKSAALGADADAMVCKETAEGTPTASPGSSGAEVEVRLVRMPTCAFELADMDGCEGIQADVNRSRRLGSVTVCIGFNELDDLVLFVPGQPVCLIECQTELARWSLGRCLPWIGAPDQVVKRDAQGIGQHGKLVGAQGNGITLPTGKGALAGPELVGQLLLREAGSSRASARRWPKSVRGLVVGLPCFMNDNINAPGHALAIYSNWVY